MRKTIFTFFALGLLFSVGQAHAATPTGQIFDMATSTNWNIRFDGPSDGGGGLTPAFGYYNVLVEDYNGDGDKDFIIGSRRLDANAVVDSGSLFFIRHELFESLTSTGNIVDLSDPSNYNLRIDGAAANDEGQRSPILADLNDDDDLDLAFAAYRQDCNGVDSGCIYILNNDKFADYTSTGNVLNLSSSSNWNLRIVGRTGSQVVGVRAANVDDNDIPDLVTSESSSGSSDGVRRVYLIYDHIFDGLLESDGNVLSLSTSTDYTVRYREAASVAFAQADIDGFQDFNNDGDIDLMISAPTSDPNPGVAGVEGSVYLIDNSILQEFGTSTGNDVNFASTTTAYTLRIAGPNGNNGLSFASGLALGDFDGDGLPEMAASVGLSPTYVYVISGERINDSYSGTGNTFSLQESSNWMIRFKEAIAGDRLGQNAPIRIVDLDNDGANDFLVSSAAGATTIDHPGKVYEFFNTALEPYFDSTGNIIDIVDSGTPIWNIRYDGDGSGDWLGAGGLQAVDINGDNQKDLVISAWGSDVNSNQSGSVYFIYYFPHEITLDDIFLKAGLAEFDVTGNVSAPNNPSNIAMVQWGHQRAFGDPDSMDFIDMWHDCEAVDGTFDSNDEDFVCHHEPLDIDEDHASPHTVFWRARDSKGIWTATENYPTRTYIHDNAISDVQASWVDNLATVTFETSDPGSTRVDILSGPGGPETGTETDTSPRVESHTTTFTATEPGNYRLLIYSEDIAGNAATTTTNLEVASGQLFGSAGGSSGGNNNSNNNSSGSSDDERQALLDQIQELTRRIAELRAQLGLDPTPGNSGSSASPVFTRDLTLGSEGQDVLNLQRFLNQRGHTLAPTGSGSPSQETTYFGERTRAALAAFQAQEGIAPAVGYFGPITRGRVLELL